jgi:hypothetical protein
MVENISYYRVRPITASRSDTTAQWDEEIPVSWTIDHFIRQQGQRVSETLPVV